MPTHRIYEPLQGAEWLRLLRIRRDADGDISGELKNFYLASESLPHFFTFSYAWGESTNKRAIKLQGQPFNVLDSVYPLLGLVCDDASFTPESWLWIDSICINQDDVDERGFQVSLMGKIYRRSTKTIVWLGEGTPETDQGMDFMHMLAAENAAIRLNNERSRRVPANLNEAEKWKALAAVLDRTWWRRLWTLQEFIIAPHSDIHCGRKCIGREKLGKAIYSIWLCCPGNELIKRESWYPGWTRRRLHQWYRHDNYWDRMGLLALMAYSSGCAVTDPRDRIYGLLGLARPSHVAMVGTPSYDHDVGAVYRAFVKLFVATHASLDIICFAQLFTGAKGGLGLPSWVPDWSQSTKVYVVPLMVSQSGRDHISNSRPLHAATTPPSAVYAASGKEPPCVIFSEDSLILTCKGVLIDHIDGLGGVPHDASTPVDPSTNPDLIQSDSPINIPTPPNNMPSPPLNTPSPSNTSEANNNQIPLLNAVVRSLVLNRRDRYLSHPAPVETFRTDLLRYAIGAKIHPYRWYHANKSLLIHGHTLEELCTPLSESNPDSAVTETLQRGMRISELAQGGVDHSEGGFLSRLQDTYMLKRMGRRLCTTRGGHVGMAPVRARKGDMVCVLFGCSVPVLLRRWEGGEGKEEWEFVGECYLDGFMDGEV
ncbi:heterokaryon incompatibility protein, partial [Podospora aff. communis PSN243]